MTELYRFAKEESGVTSIEYALIAAGIAMAIVVVVNNVGSALQGIFTAVESGLATGS
jgi:pilus assembly protein Flp/PilA